VSKACQVPSTEYSPVAVAARRAGDGHALQGAGIRIGDVADQRSDRLARVGDVVLGIEASDGVASRRILSNCTNGLAWLRLTLTT